MEICLPAWIDLINMHLVIMIPYSIVQAKKKKSRVVQLQDSDEETNDSVEYRSVSYDTY